MKTDNGHIDELLKQQFEHFAPEAPDVWEAVSQGVQQASAVSAATTQAAAQAVITTSKIWLAIAGVAAVATTTVVLILNNNSTTSEKNTADTITNPQTQQEIVTQPEEKVLDEEKPATESMRRNDAKVEASKSKPAKEATSPVHHNTNGDNPNTINNQASHTTQQIPNSIVKQEAKTEPSHPSVQKPTSTQSPAEAETPKSETVQAPTAIQPTFAEPNIPNVFTPNNDGLNDAFVIDIPDVTVYAIKIFSPRNQVVFESSNINQSWDGTNQLNGEPCEEGLYVYVLHYQTAAGASKTLRGKVKLMR